MWNTHPACGIHNPQEVAQPPEMLWVTLPQGSHALQSAGVPKCCSWPQGGISLASPPRLSAISEPKGPRLSPHSLCTETTHFTQAYTAHLNAWKPWAKTVSLNLAPANCPGLAWSLRPRSP